MKIIFLDIDGVLNSSNYFRDIKDHQEELSHLEQNIDMRTIPYLKQIVDKTGAKVVISSTWRYAHPDRTKEYVDLMKILADSDIEVIDITPFRSKSGDERGNQIRDWLISNADKNIESFVILDDDCDMCEFTETNLVRTTWFNGYGLEKEDVDLAIRILMKV